MPTIVERFRDGAINLIGGRPYRERQKNIAGLLDKAYRQGPALFSSKMMLDRLGEVDARLLDLWMRQAGYEILGGRRLGQFELTEQDRLRVVQQSRWQYHSSSQYENAITMWTDFGFGQQVEVVPIDEEAQALWDEVATSRRNSPIFKQRKLHQLSTDVLVDGEFFLAAYASTVDGQVTFRRFKTDDITQVIYDREDTDVPVWYKVKVAKSPENETGYVYFPDWESNPEDQEDEWARIIKDNRDAVKASDVSREIEINGETIKATDAVMLQVAPEMRNGRGWPKMYRFIEWDDSLRQHIGDHLAVAKSVATYVDKVTAKGGSRPVDQITAQFASTLSTGSTDWVERNPAPAAGSVLVGNEAVTVERRPLGTGASDAQTTSGLVAGQMSASSKTPLHWMGYPQQLQNRATARETNRPFIEQMERYQQFWSDIFHDMVSIVMMFAEQYNSQAFTTDEVGVTFESPQAIPGDEVSAMIDSVTAAAIHGTVDAETAERAVTWLVGLALVNLGARNVPSILEPQDTVPEDELGPEEEPPEDAGAIERIAAVIKANMEAGSVDMVAVADWAISEMVEGNGRG